MYDRNPFDIEKYPNLFAGHDYALRIVSKEIPSCKYVVGACKRYLDDIENADAEFFFDEKYAERYLRLVQKFEHVIGHWDTKQIIYDPWQKWVWMNIMGFFDKTSQFRRFRIAHVEVPRGNGKQIAVYTDVPTPQGFKKWGEIEIGSELFGRDGKVCRVVNKSPLKMSEVYRVKFSDGSHIDACQDHRWLTSDKAERDRENHHKLNPPTRKNKSGKIISNTIYETEKTTLQIFNSVTYGKDTNHLVRNTKPIEGSKKISPGIDPYYLGYWLGNGTSSSSSVTCHEDDLPTIEKLFKDRGIEVTGATRKKDSLGVTIRIGSNLHVKLREIGQQNNKHFDMDWCFLSKGQRLELLRGLIDSDGSIYKDGVTTFFSGRKQLAEGVLSLASSLGYKATSRINKVPENNNFKATKVHYEVSFTPYTEDRVANLERKYSRQKVHTADKHSYCDKRYIIDVEKTGEIVPMFCVEVDSVDHTYLVGTNFIPTHNSAMASQCSLFMMALDNPNGNMVANVATKKEQARIVLDSSRAMAQKAKAFLKETGVSVLAHTIVNKKTNSIIRALSSEKSGLDGLNDVLAVCDELHAMTREVFDVIYSGMSKRKDSLTLCITTAGFNTDSIGFSQSVYARKVCERKVLDEQFFSVIYTIDDGDDIFEETTWRKCNPSYGSAVDAKTFEAKARKAQTEPQDIPNFKVKHLNIWLSEMNSFFDVDKLKLCANTELKLEDFKGKKCRLGVDIASHVDLTSIGIVFREKDIFYIFDKSYIPEARAREVKNVLFDECIGKGFLTATEGEAIDQDKIEEEIKQIAKDYKVLDINLDPWNTVALMQRLEKARLPTNEFRMSVANLSEPMKKLDAAIRKGQVVYNGSPLLTWCFSNVVAKRDAADNVFPRKTNEKLKIDAVIAILMAVASWIQDDEKESIYNSRGVRHF